MCEQGKRLAQCVNAISAYGKEIDVLRETLNRLLVDEIENCPQYARHADDIFESSQQDAAEWVYTDISYSIPLQFMMGPAPQNPVRYLGYQISLCGDGISFCDNEEPLLHVYFWRHPSDFEESYMCPELLEGSTTEHNKHLIVWPGPRDGLRNSEWTFSLRLLTLDSGQTLLERVVRPAIRLASLAAGADIADVLPDNLPGLLAYP